MSNDYIKLLEEQNENLRKELSKMHEYYDKKENELSEKKLETSLKLLVEKSLEHQNKCPRERIVLDQFINEYATIQIAPPRQIGLSTDIIKAVYPFFDRIDIITNMRRDKKHDKVYFHINNLRNLQGIRLECVIVDPWNFMYNSFNRESWSNVRYEIISRMNLEKPCLLILAG